MNIKITGKDLTATEAIKDYVSKKVERIENTLYDIMGILRQRGI